jgi:hypothetical protein
VDASSIQLAFTSFSCLHHGWIQSASDLGSPAESIQRYCHVHRFFAHFLSHAGASQYKPPPQALNGEPTQNLRDLLTTGLCCSFYWSRHLALPVTAGEKYWLAHYLLWMSSRILTALRETTFQRLTETLVNVDAANAGRGAAG